jgi:hypothetical protein
MKVQFKTCRVGATLMIWLGSCKDWAIQSWECSWHEGRHSLGCKYGVYACRCMIVSVSSHLIAVSAWREIINTESCSWVRDVGHGGRRFGTPLFCTSYDLQVLFYNKFCLCMKGVAGRLHDCGVLFWLISLWSGEPYTLKYNRGCRDGRTHPPHSWVLASNIQYNSRLLDDYKRLLVIQMNTERLHEACEPENFRQLLRVTL